MVDPKVEALVRTEMNRMRGRLAGFIEACQLAERQERSIISTMKSFSYDAENHIVEKLDQQ